MCRKIVLKLYPKQFTILYTTGRGFQNSSNDNYPTRTRFVQNFQYFTCAAVDFDFYHCILVLNLTVCDNYFYILIAVEIIVFRNKFYYIVDRSRRIIDIFHFYLESNDYFGKQL